MKFRNNKAQQNGRQNKNVNRRLGLGVNKANQRQFKVTAKPGTVKKVDARLRIQQKKRNVVDARDVLAKMAKTQDARNKLIKIRQTRVAGPPGANIRAIGSGSIIQKTDPNGKISLVTKKSASSPITTEIRKQLGLGSSSQPQRQKKSNMALLKQQRIQANRLKANLQRTDLHISPLQRFGNSSSIRKTILNDMMPRSEDLYSWIRPDLRLNPMDIRRQQQQQPPPMRLSVRNDYDDGMASWRYDVNPQRAVQLQQSYVDLDAVQDEEMPYMDAVPTRTSVRSRLDQVPQSQSTSHGILSQTKTKVVVPAGHRIVISNLQSSVTQEDIRELFEDIGQLLVSRLVRPGTAEVIYKNLKDAQKAVDTYHNRQLDGQPMKCLLVNKRPINNPTGPAAKVSPMRASPTKTATTKLTPDISTIHKVLFHNKT